MMVQFKELFLADLFGNRSKKSCLVLYNLLDRPLNGMLTQKIKKGSLYINSHLMLFRQTGDLLLNSVISGNEQNPSWKENTGCLAKADI